MGRGHVVFVVYHFFYFFLVDNTRWYRASVTVTIIRILFSVSIPYLEIFHEAVIFAIEAPLIFVTGDSFIRTTP